MYVRSALLLLDINSIDIKLIKPNANLLYMNKTPQADTLMHFLKIKNRHFISKVEVEQQKRYILPCY